MTDSTFRVKEITQGVIRGYGTHGVLLHSGRNPAWHPEYADRYGVQIGATVELKLNGDGEIVGHTILVPAPPEPTPQPAFADPAPPSTLSASDRLTALDVAFRWASFDNTGVIIDAGFALAERIVAWCEGTAQ